MLVDINRLHPDPTPVRHRIWPEDDAALRNSIAELGMLEPLLVIRLAHLLADIAHTRANAIKDET